MSKYFVYELLDPRFDPPVPFYVGISKDHGTKRYRPKEHLKEAKKPGLPAKCNRLKICKIRKIIAADLEPLIIITHWFDTREEAIAQEISSISKYGRLDNGTGILTNLTDGGEGSVGKVYTEEERRLKSIQAKGEKNGMFGKRHSLESKQAISDKNKGKVMHPISEKQKEAIRESNRTRVVSDRIRERGRQFFLERGLGKMNKGKKLSEETRAKISQSRKDGKYGDPTIYTWFHEVYGIEQCTRLELIEKYADRMIIHASNLTNVVSGKYTQTKGWKLLDNPID